MNYVLRLLELERELKRRWVLLLTSGVLGFKSSESFALLTFAIIAKKYNEEWRRYHTLFHIKRMLDEMDAVHHALQNPAFVEFAIFLHDIIYDVTRKDNEKRSGKVARAWLIDMGASVRVVRIISRLITVGTVHPKKLKSRLSRDEKFISDFDLSGFSLLWPEVVENSKNVRREYSEISDKEFRIGHHKFLASLMFKPIFKTEHYLALHEINARNNIFSVMKNGDKVIQARPKDKR